MPINISDEDRRYFKCDWNYFDPEITIHYFSFLFRKGYSTNILLKSIKKIEPWTNFYKNFNRSFFLGKILQAIGKQKLKIVAKKKYYCCVNELSNNFFHWFTEALPKMIYVKNLLKKEVSFYFPFALSDYQKISLDLCDLNSMSTDKEVTFFYKLKIVENFYKHPGYYHSTLQRELSHLIKGKFNFDINKRRKIYVTRRNAVRRKVINEDAVIDFLLSYEFEIFDFDKTSFEEQISILRNTHIFISLHGAALTNMIFMNPGSTVIEFLPKELYNDKCYFVLAGTMGLNYYYLTCHTEGENHITSDFFVDINGFEKILCNALYATKVSEN